MQINTDGCESIVQNSHHISAQWQFCLKHYPDFASGTGPMAKFGPLGCQGAVPTLVPSSFVEYWLKLRLLVAGK